MQEPDDEGVANHVDPESCGGAREDAVEALTGARAGTVLSREISKLGRRRRPEKRKATCGLSQSRDGTRPRAVRDLLHVRNLPAREPGDPSVV